MKDQIVVALLASIAGCMAVAVLVFRVWELRQRKRWRGLLGNVHGPDDRMTASDWLIVVSCVVLIVCAGWTVGRLVPLP